MRLTRADKWLIGILLALACGGIGLNLAVLSPSGDRVAVVEKEGRPIAAMPLRAGYRQELRVDVADGYNIVEADNGRVRIREADCPDQICVRSGWISAAPQQVVCLPHRLVVRVESTRPADVDEITR